jgi:hypothetical protein
MHYYAVAVLARASGYSESGALTLATASQFVDDSTDSTFLPVPGAPLNRFHLIRTAHIGLEAFNPLVQDSVYVPFHFLPQRPPISPDDSWACVPDGDWSRSLLQPHVKAARDGGIDSLMSLGIALHTYLDQWSHATFTGRREPVNHVGWKVVNGIRSWLELSDLFLPPIGHAEARFDPDVSSSTIWLGDDTYGPRLQRTNSDAFLDALIHAYCRIGGAQEDLTPLLPRLQSLLASPGTLDEVCSLWSSSFPDLFPSGFVPYSSTGWRVGAVSTPTPAFYDTPFVRWHRAALLQQAYVLEKL